MYRPTARCLHRKLLALSNDAHLGFHLYIYKPIRRHILELNNYKIGQVVEPQSPPIGFSSGLN